MNISFELFLAIALEMRGHKIAPHQQAVARWLESTDKSYERLLMLCREGSKSDMISCYAAWRLVVNPDQSILIVSGNREVASNNLRQVKELIETHPACRKLYERIKKDKKKSAWTRSKLEIPGTKVREPNLHIVSVHGTSTGLRAGLIILDDLEIEENCRSVERHNWIKDVFVPQMVAVGQQLLHAGTSHGGVESMYRYLELGLKAEDIFKLPFFDGFFPERFTQDRLDKIFGNAEKNIIGMPKNFVDAQYYLKYVKIAAGDLDPADLIDYDEPVTFHERFTRTGQGEEKHYITKIGDRIQVAVEAFWDVAAGKPGGDHSVLSVVYLDVKNNYSLHRLESLPYHDGSDHFEKQRKRICRILNDLKIRRVYVEEAGPAVHAAALGKVARDMNIPLDCIEHRQTVNKAKRIYHNIAPILQSGKFYISKQISEKDRQMFDYQLQTFPDCVKADSMKDDHVDSPSSAIELLDAPNFVESLEWPRNTPTLNRTGQVLGTIDI